MRRITIRAMVLVVLLAALLPVGWNQVGAVNTVVANDRHLLATEWKGCNGPPSSSIDVQVDVAPYPTPSVKCADVQPPPPLPLSQEQEVLAATQQTLDEYNSGRAISDTLTILSVGGKDNWAIAECVPVLQRDSIGGTEGTLMLLGNVSGVWKTALPGDSVYSLWLEKIPPQYLSPMVKEQMQQLNLVAPELIDPSDGIYRLPYANGATVRVTQDSDRHGGPIDFWSANGSIVAAMDGWVDGFYDDHTECCCNSACGSCNNWIRLRHDNGEYTDYHHIAYNSVQVNPEQWVPAGTVIATQDDVGWSCGIGRDETSCGSFNQNNPNYNCAVHLHFAVIAGGVARKPRFCDGSGGWFYPVGGQNYTAQSCPGSSNQPPNPPPLDSPTNGIWLGSRTVTLSWHDGGDLDNQPRPYRDYYAEIWRAGWSQTLNWTTNTSWQVTVPGDGAYSWHVMAGDGAAGSAWSETRTFTVDASPPLAPTISISSAGCAGIQNNVWQNTCYDPAFTYHSSDSGSGVKDYHRYWGTASGGSPDTWTTDTTFDPGAIAAADGFARYYLNLTARDNLLHESGRSSFGVWYDGSIPTVTMSVNNGAATTNQAAVHLDLSAADTGSGVTDVRVSNNGLTWSDWQPYPSAGSGSALPWTLPTLDRRTLTVYVQVRDQAGNESAVANDSIYLDLYPPMPHSDNYRICADVIDVGGSVGITSTGYTLVSAIGQPWATGAISNTSHTFSQRAGFLASLTGCLPITYFPTTGISVTQWVVASGGNLRGSTSYRLGDTAGQPAASGTSAFTSTNYTLSSGFWATLSGTVPERPPDPPSYPSPGSSPTPTPGPTPTPQPGGFGVSINDGALYTNDPAVTVHTWAPNVTHQRLSDDGGYADQGWMTYRITTTWALSTYGEYVMPRYVYAWFRDASSNVYGPYFDDIFYDPVAPEGQIYILGSEIVTVTLWLEAYDDNSGVAEMRVSENRALSDAVWQPFTNTLEWVLSSNVVYAQFSDNAGNLSSVYSSADPGVSERIYLPLIIRNQ